MGRELLDSMIAETCWHISAGGPTAPSFLVVMGGRIPRSEPLRNPRQPDEFRHNRGTVELLVWSSWRLQNRADVLATSDQGEIGLDRIRSLIGTKVTMVSCLAPAWDLNIHFSDGTELLTFSDHLEPDASIALNWELWCDGQYLRAGPGGSLVKE